VQIPRPQQAAGLPRSNSSEQVAGSVVLAEVRAVEGQVLAGAVVEEVDSVVADRALEPQ
jgi:hypothetical protein